MSSAGAKIVREILISDTDVTDLASNRIKPGIMEQGQAKPGIVYNIIGVTPTNHKDGSSAKDMARIQVTSYATQAIAALDLADEVRKALDRATPAAYNGITLVESRFDDMDQEYDVTARVHYVNQDFMITYKR